MLGPTKVQNITETKIQKTINISQNQILVSTSSKCAGSLLYTYITSLYIISSIAFVPNNSLENPNGDSIK